MNAERVPRILVVDDEEYARTLVGWLFQDQGYDVELAGDGWRALDAIELRRPDLVVLDLRMAGLDGWEVLAHLRGLSDPPPVVVTTVCGDAESFARAVREGAAGYVFKPFRVRDFLGTCERVLLARRMRSDSGGPERRREPRRLLAVEARAEAEGQMPIAWGTLLDLSPSGARLDLAAPLEPGSRVTLELPLAHGETALLTLAGRVQWRGPTPSPGFVHGLVFEGLPPESERQIRELLAPA